MKKAVQIFYIILVLAFLCLPSVGRLFLSQSAAENEIENEIPFLKENGTFNIRYLSDLGDYFEQHFALRSRYISANAKAIQTVFQESADDGVIVGSDGWLYYADSLDDYLGTHPMSDRQILNLARSLSMMETYLDGRGIDFLYVPVPNKNTLYGEHMPYFDKVIVSKEHNLFRLYEALQNEGVSYLNLYEAFKGHPRILYHKTDSHWTNQGAALASTWILKRLGKPTPDYEKESYLTALDFTGDLEKMLYPDFPAQEEEIYYDRGHSFSYVTETESNYDPYIQTVSPEKSGSVVVYRDSFGNALLPFLADAYGEAFFSRGGVYSVTDVENHHADTLIIERAERLLWSSLPYPYIIPAAAVLLPEDLSPVDTYLISRTENTSEENTFPSLTQNGGYLQLKGFLPEALADPNCYIYVRLQDGKVYETVPCSYRSGGQWHEFGYCVNLNAQDYPDQSMEIEVYITDTQLEQIPIGGPVSENPDDEIVKG